MRPRIAAAMLMALIPSTATASDIESGGRIDILSCYNPEMTSTPCGSWGDPDYMVVRMFDEPNGKELARITDQGIGFCATLIRTVHVDSGEAWHLVVTDRGQRGFVPASAIIAFPGCPKGSKTVR